MTCKPVREKGTSLISTVREWEGASRTCTYTLDAGGLGVKKALFSDEPFSLHIIRAQTDVCRQVANNPGTFADNPGRSPGLFSANSGRRTCLFAGTTVYVCKLLQLAMRVGGYWR